MLKWAGNLLSRMKQKKALDWKELARELKEAQKDPNFVKAVNEFIGRTSA